MSDRRPENLRDIVDPYVAEALYDETIAWNIDMRGGGSVLEWPSWEELPDMAREHWMSMAVTARVATRAALESSEPADLLAVVRRGVESGTIKGKPWTWCNEHDAPGGPQDGGPWDDKCYEWWLCEVLGDECDGVTPCRIVETLVIPVSDGGSET